MSSIARQVHVRSLGPAAMAKIYGERWQLTGGPVLGEGGQRAVMRANAVPPVRSAPNALHGVGGDSQLDQPESRLVARHRSRDSKTERDQRAQQCGRHERERHPPDGEGDYTGHECDQTRADQAGVMMIGGKANRDGDEQWQGVDR